MKQAFDDPPASFHVQQTAAALRDGFPWFDHHRSVETLWREKWREPCSRGLHPFWEGALADFDPIFADLIERSPGGTEILHRPDDYAEAFLATGDRLIAEAGRAMDERRPLEAKALFLRAAAVFRMARFPIIRSPVGEEAWRRNKAAYEAAGHLMAEPIIEVELPFSRLSAADGDEDRPIPAYLRIPKKARPASGWPVLVFICGLDSYRTDNTAQLNRHLQQGFATLIVEVPGTADCPASPNDSEGADRWMESVLDWIWAEATTWQFDLERVVGRAISTGGYHAFRAAHNQADRFLAIAEQGGGCHHMFDPRWIEHQDQMEYPFALGEALAWKFGFRGSDAVATYARDGGRFSLLEGGILDKDNCRLLIVNGMEDTIFPIEDSFCVATRRTGKNLSIVGNTGHMGNPQGQETVFAWLADAIG